MARRNAKTRLAGVPMDPAGKKYLAIQLDGAFDFLISLLEKLGAGGMSMLDLFDPALQLKAHRSLRKADLVDYGYAIGRFEGAAGVMRVPVSALLLEIGDLHRSGQLEQWRCEMLESAGGESFRELA